jgi:hypothetical protein
VDEDVNIKAKQAQALFEKITQMLTGEHGSVVGAVIASLLAGFVGAHEPPDRDDALERLMLLVSKIVGDLDKANGIETEGGIRFGIEVDDTVREQMQTNPKLAEFVRDQTSRVRQALSDFQAGKYRSVDDAMRSIGLDEVDEDDLVDLRDRTAARKLPRKPS